jgi:excisionase family DNA binding protein
MKNDIVTTSQAAKLLGVSVRTAQLLIEGGSLTSWKTPGGHRRVYRADVLAFKVQKNHAPAFSSALVVLLASPARLSLYEELLAAISECSTQTCSDVYAASFTIGSQLPGAVVVDLEHETAERLSFLSHLAANPGLGHTHLIAVGGPKTLAEEQDLSRPYVHIAQPAQLPAVVRAALRDADEPAEVFVDPPSFPLAANEGQRLAALQRSGLVDTAPEESFDRLTWLAGHSLKMPIALMTLLTPSRQWFKSRYGLEITETPRSWAFCNRTILQKDVFAVEDLAREAPYAANPVVVGSPHLRFYAGAPVVDPDGFALGSLCVMDYEPRTLDAEQEQALRTLASLASAEVRLRAIDRQLRWAFEALNRTRKRKAAI